MIQEVDKPGSEISSYIDSLGAVLDQHISSIDELYNRLVGFRHKLKEEHRLSRICLTQADPADSKESAPMFQEEEAFDEPRGRMNKVQSSYEHPGQRSSNYKS